jgi:hypothetical protein
MKLTIQSVRINKKIPKTEANRMIKEMGYKVTPPDKKNNPQYSNYHSYRQLDPNRFVPNSFRIKKLGDILFVLGLLA